jgi:N-methylhydantoinase A/oxoprolinase/acetone carboxylase beta subunit
MTDSRHIRLGIDVGGTFTDLAAIDDTDGSISVKKVLTTPEDPWIGISKGVELMVAESLLIDDISSVIHGTTLVTNAIIERRGAKVGLITTRGFRDILYFGREFRYDIYDPELVLPDPLVARAFRREVDERIGADGEVVRAMDESAAREVVRGLLADGAESIAVCLLHSYRYPQHEAVLGEIVHAENPEIPVALSHEVLPQIREYERSSATALNAYVQPVVRRYLYRLREGLRALGCTAPLYLMTSSGGTITVETAVAFPIQLIESGPAAGTLVASLIGQQVGAGGVVSFDMGGTTAKSCVIKSQRPLINKTPEVARERRTKKGSGFPVGLPMVDLLEIGAGGGSIAELDRLGLLRVGPRSASANPGPACYGLGGQEATVTDADLVLGLIDPDSFLSGSMHLDRDAALRAITENVARPLGLQPVEAAAAIHRVVTDNMAEATRVHSAEVNVDLRGYWLVAFGGAGPLHAYGVAERLGLPVVVFPRNAGVLSATGLLTAPLAFEFSRSYPVDLGALDVSMANRLLSELEERARGLLAASGLAATVNIQRTVDMCYSGQRYEVATPLPEPPLTADSVAELKTAFDTTYEETYGRRLTLLPASCLTWRVLASGPAPVRWWRTLPAMSGRSAKTSSTRQRRSAVRTAFLPGHGQVECQIHLREDITPGSTITGPALVEDGSSTIVLPPNAKGTIDSWGNLIVRLSTRPAAAVLSGSGGHIEGATC